MDSPFAKIYLGIERRISAEMGDDIPYIDQDLGQLETKERPSVAFPCILIDFSNWTFKPLTGNVQEAFGTVTVKLAYPPYSSANAATPDVPKEHALKYFDLEWKLYKALQGYSPQYLVEVTPANPPDEAVYEDELEDITGSLDRTSVVTDNRRIGLRVRVMAFSLAFQDHSAEPKKQTAPVRLNLTTQFTPPA